ncbi:hypothetical protein E4U21_002483 [Claviceps maximensis]|nr:hypothetical protein E4U21_002483 [Claviceps maximensis]
MAAKPKAMALKGGHTAGIFADMTVDGPVIGTLVAVVDRAKNLPNRKTIGKQDPFCAARLGKEAKKTKTDIRGGQTPKWDQELRFTVHDSPDYYQLKMSVFTDDKKTDLIGEAWIDLKAIIVSGGGQSDMWQGLTCRGKYAGEIRLEITFYDSRPRPERSAAKQRQQAAADQDSGGSSKQRKHVKRRPLPSDPVTGEAPPMPSVAVPAPQEQVHNPRSHAKSASQSHIAHISTQSPLQSAEYNHTSPQGARPQRGRDPYTPSPTSAHCLGPRAFRESYGTPSRYQDERGYAETFHASPYGHQDPRGSYESFSDVQGMNDDRILPSSFENDVPPPPPAHGSRQHSAGPDAGHHYEISPQKSSTPMRQDVLNSEAYRHSISAYPGQPAVMAHDPSMSAPMQIASRHSPSHESLSSSTHMSRSAGHSPIHSSHHRSMQPTVEDDPDSSSKTQNSQASRHVQAYQSREVELSRSQRSSSYVPPSVPLSLSSGVDLALSRELCDPYYIDSRHSAAAGQPTTPTRGRQHSEEPPSYDSSSQAYVSQSYDGQSMVPYSSRSAQQATRPRNTSSPNPNPQHAIRRKSVSPAPLSAEDRRLSDVPFDPDSYNAFNPSITAPGRAENTTTPAKIIGHDGREIDPSDYLPMDTWAPEPEPRGNEQAPPEPHAEPPSSAAQPLPPSGRRTLRIAGRHSMPAQERPYAPPTYGQTDIMRTPPAAGRQRLQKKSARASTGYSGHTASMSSPLAPISPGNYQERQSQYTPTRSSRMDGSFGYPSENHGPQYGSIPPIPAKLPLAIMSGPSGDTDMTLMEEMQRIDIGAGRSRRRGGR